MADLRAYVLATHGRRKLHREHPAIRQQVLNLERAFEMAGGSGELPFLHDYCRNVRGLGSLPALQKHLQAGASVLLDDIGRLFRACESSGLRKALHRELLPYASSIRGVRQNMKVLSDLSQAHTELLFSGQLDPKFVLVSSKRKRSSVDLAEQTYAATEASAQARHDAALKVARQLGEVHDRVVASGEKATVARIAEQANADGLRTTRGSLWRADTVSRALKRLEQADRQAEASQNDA